MKKQLENMPNYDKKTNTLTTRESRVVDVDLFCKMFKDYELSYESLIKSDYAKNGWDDIFNEWKEKGYIN